MSLPDVDQVDREMQTVQPRKLRWQIGWTLAILLIVATPIAFCCGLTYWGMSAFQQPLRVATEALEAEPIVVRQLGRPLTSDFFAYEHFESSNGFGYAQIATTFRGPKGEVFVSGRMNQDAGQWTVGELRVALDDGFELVIPSDE